MRKKCRVRGGGGQKSTPFRPLAGPQSYAKNRKIKNCCTNAKRKASIKMGAFLFVYIPRQTKNVVRPSYDGQSLMGKDSVVKRRSVCQGKAPKTALGTDEQLVSQVAVVDAHTQINLLLSPSPSE